MIHIVFTQNAVFS